MPIVDAGAPYEVVARRRRGPAIRQRLGQDLHGRGHRHIGVRHIGRCSAGAGGTGGRAEPRAPQGTRSLRWLARIRGDGPAPFRVASAGHGSGQGGPWHVHSGVAISRLLLARGKPTTCPASLHVHMCAREPGEVEAPGASAAEHGDQGYETGGQRRVARVRLALAAMWPAAARSCRSFASSA